MNIYDFDKTIYKGDSSIDFYLYVLRKKPIIIKYFPKQVLGFVLYFFKKIQIEEFKERFFSFITSINVENMVAKFWEEKADNINKWYYEKQEFDDIVISASPYFLIKPICEKIGIRNVISTIIDIDNGRILGKNCKGIEKVNRLYEKYSNPVIDKFYSDSKTDEPLARLAQEAFIVKNNKIEIWKY